ncbi:MAG: threonylcarbamoyl-AMP synthase [Pseudomonadales bacterium]|nr:threonylcarbamoyl-AMP synthase [Pseudomonadales bacterium]
MNIQQTVPLLKQGAVIAYPTEAVWGLGCDPFDEKAVSRVLTLKSRSVDKGLILIAGSIEQFAFLLDDLASDLLAKLHSSWPGPTTWLIPHRQRVPAWIHGDHKTVAVRVTAHAVAAQLCVEFGGPLVSTSANPQGLPAATTAAGLEAYFSTRLDGIVSGELGGAQQPSIIRDLLTDEIIRGSS